MLAGRVGGTPVIMQNGNRWTGAGHNAVFQDAAGQWWTIHHAVDRHDAVLGAVGGAGGVTQRPALLDRIDGIAGWPVLGVRLANGRLTMATQATDLQGDTNNAAALTMPLPQGSYVVPARVRLGLVAMGGNGYEGSFEQVRIARLRE